MAAREASGTHRRGERIVAAALLAGWLAMPAFVLAVDEGNRVFWTVLVASLPLAWIVLGFHAWRRNCPLAAMSQVARVLGRPGQRRISGRFAANAILFQLGVMIACLSLRLLGANGTPVVLAVFLVTLSAAALASGFVFGGKTWCNHLCPVALVEKIYTEPVQLVSSGNSQCAACTACKKHCPDIDAEQHYWKESQETPRRIAYFAWPGVVLGFYAWFWLWGGDWDAYFGGRWTRQSVSLGDLAGPGFWFAPIVPWALSVPVTLVAFGAVSYSLFSSGENAALRRGADAARARHLSLALAGFAAISIFYVFAGQPTLRLAPDWVRQAIVFGAWFACALLFFRRWTRTERDFVRERFARKILKRWTEGDSPDGDDLNEVYVVHEERKRQREERLKAYAETLRELVADGVLTRDKLSVLDAMRGQLGITDAEHERVLKGLEETDRALFDPDVVQSADERLQEEQYRKALEALVQDAAARGVPVDGARLEDLRSTWGVSRERHGEILVALQDPESGLQRVVREELTALARLGDAVVAARSSSAPDEHVDLVVHACRHAAVPRVERVLAVHRSLGGRDPEASAEDLLLGPPGAHERLVGFAAEDAAIDTLRQLAEALRTLTDPPAERATAKAGLVAAVRAAAEVSPRLDGVADLLEGVDSAPARRLEAVVALRSVELLRGLPPEALDSLAQVASRRVFADGEALCTQGEVGEEVFVLLRGRARVWLTDNPNKKLSDCEPGSCVGELAALDPAPRAANVAAVGEVEALVLSGEDFRGMLDRHPDIAQGVLRELVQRLRTRG